MGTKYVVASGHYLASMAGMRVLEAGGNAVDAGVATGLCLNVLQPDMTNLGGVAPIILRRARTDELVSISGLGGWPQAATLEEVLRRGGDLSSGILTCVVPAALDAWLTALDGYGTMPFREVAAPAIELAEHGFPVNHMLHGSLTADAARLEGWPSTRDVFLRSGTPPEVGSLLVQADLGKTLRMLAEAERGASTRHQGLAAARRRFYEGDIAERIAAFCREMDGLLCLEDLASFRVKIEPVLTTSYRGFDVCSCGPWCQGPVVLQALNILEGYDIPSMPFGSVEVLHRLVEALKAAFADRHAYYGDPDFVRVPIAGLMSKDYAAQWRARITLDAACPEMPLPGDPWAYERSAKPGGTAAAATPAVGSTPRDTSYVCVLDAEGNAFSATPSDGIEHIPLVPGLGFAVSSRGRQSWVEPTHPSCIAPGKRPRLTPSPGLVMKDGKVCMAVGTPGADVQPQAMVQMLMNVIDYGMGVQAAIEAPRLATYSFPGSFYPHAYAPGLVRAEARIPSTTTKQLIGMGHRVEMWPPWTPEAGSLCAIMASGDGVLLGGADPRRLAYAIGW